MSAALMRRVAHLVATVHYAAPNRAHCACGWTATVDAARFSPGWRDVTGQYEDHLAEALTAALVPTCKHDWSYRGESEDRWRECYLCGEIDNDLDFEIWVLGRSHTVLLEARPCGHLAAVEPGCGGCDPSAIETVIDDHGTRRPFDPTRDLTAPEESR